MKYVAEESIDTEINYFNLKDNNDLQVMECGYINMETHPRMYGTVDGVDVYTVVNAMKKRVASIDSKRSVFNTRHIIDALEVAEKAIKNSKDNRIYRGEKF